LLRFDDCNNCVIPELFKALLETYKRAVLANTLNAGHVLHKDIIGKISVHQFAKP